MDQEREAKLRDLATMYAIAESEKLELEVKIRELETAKENRRLEAERLTKQMHNFVGRNQPKRVVRVGDDSVVIIQLIDNDGQDYVSVSREPLL